MLHAQVEAQTRETIRAEMNRINDKRWYMRLKIIDLSSQGQSVSLLAQVFDLSEATIRSYIHRFNTAGMAGLRPEYGIGRPATLTWTQAEWLDVLAQSPANLPLLASQARNWTQALLCQYLQAYHQIEVSQPTVAKYLCQVGIRWRRAKLRVYSPDPLYQLKRQRIQHLQQMALGGDLTSRAAAHPRSDEPPKRAFLVFLDSTDLHWCPDLGNTYTAAGVQTKVNSPGHANPWYALFGSLIFPSGEGHYTVHERKRSDELLVHLRGLLEMAPDAFWFVVLDNASAHTTTPVQTFAQQHQAQLELVYLPTYSPHLNPIERLWHFMRRQVTRNYFFADLPSLAQAAINWLATLPFAHFCSLFSLDEQHLVFLQQPFE
jgi:transposase